MGVATGAAISVLGLGGAGFCVAVSAMGVGAGALASRDFACVQLLRGT
jgi:hypothetical protein